MLKRGKISEGERECMERNVNWSSSRSCVFFIHQKGGQQSRLSLPMKLKQWRQSVEGMAEDAEFIMEKIKDIAEKTPEVIEIVKEAYSWKKDDRPRIK